MIILYREVYHDLYDWDAASCQPPVPQRDRFSFGANLFAQTKDAFVLSHPLRDERMILDREETLLIKP